MQQGLKQRNAALRNEGASPADVACWDEVFIEPAMLISQEREVYIKRLQPVFTKMLGKMLLKTQERIELVYSQGWDKERSLRRSLADSFYRDKQRGYTHVGPQRADLRVLVNNISVADRFSRGQIKLLVCALKLAQIELFTKDQEKVCTLLIDDLPSELDCEHLKALCGLLQELKVQIFVTCVDEKVLAEHWYPGVRVSLFHVEHGGVLEIKHNHVESY